MSLGCSSSSSCYLSPPTVDNGLIEFSAHSYGGFAYRADTLEKATNWEETEGGEEQGGQRRQIPKDPTKRFLTEHNLALFWRRPGLFPRVPAFPVPLLSTADDYAVGVQNRPPGNLRVDSAPIRYRQRNLLAGELMQEENTIRLWAVNDSSDHKQLLTYSLRLVDPHSCRRRNLLRLERAEEADRLKLDREVLQLRGMESPGRKGLVFMRTNRSLDLADSIRQSVSTIFSSQIRAFTQIPHMDGELALSDSQGMLFWGHIDRQPSFSRFKFPASLKALCPSDCPRVLLAIGDKELHQIDLREPPNSAGHLLFSQSPIQPIDGPFSPEVYACLTARDLFCHLSSLDVQLETVMVTSTRRHTLIDRRMPGLPMLSMPHAEIDGADYCITTPPFTDPETGGRVFSLYSLTQIRKPALSHWAVMFHPAECLWSSMGPKYQLDSPRRDISDFVQLHSAMPPVQTVRMPKWTRAIHYQPLDPNLPISSTRALLFRQMEGGEIWYENVFFDPLPKLRQGGRQDELIEEDGDYEGSYEMAPIDELKMKRKALEQIEEYQQRWRNEEREGEEQQHSAEGRRGMHPFFREVQDQLLVIDRTDQLLERFDCTSLSIAAEFGDLPNGDLIFPHPFSNVHRIDPSPYLDIADQPPPFELDAQTLEKQQKLFSSSVLAMWQKTVKLWGEAKTKRMQKELGLMDIVREEEEEEMEGMEEEDKEGKMMNGRGGAVKKGMMEEDEEEWKKEEMMGRRKRKRGRETDEMNGNRRTAEEEEVEEVDEYAFEVDLEKGTAKKRSGGREGDDQEEEEEEEEENGDEDEYNFEVELD